MATDAPPRLLCHPVIIGGGHSIEFANVVGLADVYGKENVGVIHCRGLIP